MYECVAVEWVRHEAIFIFPAPQPYVVPYHVQHILHILKDQVMHHSYATATASMETLAMAMDLVPDVMRELGVDILTSDSTSYREALRLLKSMLAWQPKHVCKCGVQVCVCVRVCIGNSTLCSTNFSSANK